MTIPRQLRHIMSAIASILVLAFAIIPLTVEPKDLKGWKVWIFIIAAVVAIFYVIAYYIQWKEDTVCNVRDQERDILIKKIAETVGATVSRESAPSSSFQTQVSTDDPQLYLSLPYPRPGAGLRAPIVLENRGKTTAHNVKILQFELKHKNVTFPVVSEICPGTRREILPQVEGTGPMLSHDLFHWLIQDWDGKGELTNDWPIKMTLNYTDPAGSNTIQQSVTLLFHPITFMMKRKQQDRGRQAPWNEEKAAVEFTDYKFERLQS